MPIGITTPNYKKAGCITLFSGEGGQPSTKDIGNNKTESLQDFINTIEIAMGKKAIKEIYPMQQGDVLKTFADITELIKDYKYSPSTDIKSGIQSFVKWFINYKKK